ncbi:unnamed protein product [Didymodactylos carnosus]|uniref:UBX domain-containing protein n=1 Tax=Didymodactylos carnosus TaxID=1234261 RepID=A0A813SR52_9BILA|nr:unnamed protein product [Didymodactylos carnosus]CAF0803514.1 unnamed protein product [Didymodactylos carnosus]CAF3512868.1 unnamed protein product [Didymodactylos carnosus]CAF3588761.1 unnamed protein product [Didymodactylos carnosus]
MSKNTINILCPSGHRRKFQQMTPNTKLLQVLDEICTQENLDPSEWGFIHQRVKCDLTIPWRLSQIPTNAQLEMYKLDQRRSHQDVTVQLQLTDGTRYSGLFEPVVTLQELLDWFRVQPESIIAAVDISVTDTNTYPVCSYMNEEIVGEYALSNTTLRELGLTGGTAVIRYHHRTVSNDEIKRINNQIDEKIVRRRQQQQKQQTTAINSQSQNASLSTTNTSQSLSSNWQSPSQHSTLENTMSTTREPPRPIRINDNIPSIFQDQPVTTQRTNRGPQPNQSPTLAQALGINLSFDERLDQRPRVDFSNFKFPESTKGKNLYQNESADQQKIIQNWKPCDRQTLVYDLTKIKKNRDTRDSDLPDTFFELTPNDLRLVLTDLKRLSDPEEDLKTRAMREGGGNKSCYEHIAIRLVVNNRYILQGLFRPTEPVSRLYDFVRKSIRQEQTQFYLYTSPPKIEIKDLFKTLIEYELAPAAYVYIGTTNSKRPATASASSTTLIELKPELIQPSSLKTLEYADKIVSQEVFEKVKQISDEDAALDTLGGLTNTTQRPTSSLSMSAQLSTSTQRPRQMATTNNDTEIKAKLAKFLPSRK